MRFVIHRRPNQPLDVFGVTHPQLVCLGVHQLVEVEFEEHRDLVALPPQRFGTLLSHAQYCSTALQGLQNSELSEPTLE